MWKKLELIFQNAFVANRNKEIVRQYSRWIKNGKKILDVGCADGILSAQIADAMHATVSGCDVVDIHLRNIPFKKMLRSDMLPYKNSEFDYVVFTDTLHHATRKDQLRLLKESCRVSRKYVIIFEAKPTFTAFVADFLLNKLSHPKVPVTLTFRTSEEWLSILRDYFRKIHLEPMEQNRFTFFQHYLFVLEKS